MRDTTEATQEPRTERVGYMTTRDEKRDVQLVAAFDNATESDTVRNHTIDQIRERAADIRAGRAVAAGAA